ncbi:unnamed protein product [Ectocarpus sp. 8 AP-2014]
MVTWKRADGVSRVDQTVPPRPSCPRLNVVPPPPDAQASAFFTLRVCVFAEERRRSSSSRGCGEYCNGFRREREAFVFVLCLLGGGVTRNREHTGEEKEGYIR